jgi:cytochrome c oxidase cbb3-type subunit 2
MLLLILAVISIGGLVEIVPLFYINETVEKVEGVRPYTPLEQRGRDIYIREGCYLCHSQQIRPFRDEWLRYGHYSLAAESQYDHPFQWGSKRTGPDLARVGGKYSNDWHYAHLIAPRSLVPESVMPAYPFLANNNLDFRDIANHLTTLRIVGTPYTDAQVEQAIADVKAQGTGEGDTDGLLSRYPKAVVGPFGGATGQITEADAVIAYLQMLGTLVDFKDYRPELDYR